MTYPVTQIKLGEENYSKLLTHIPDPPKLLYCRGNLELLNSECIGVVGTRKLTPYGKESAQYITRGLATAGFTIVSGLAMGIDAMAHQTTLDIGSRTIAVLGGGVSDANIGPRINLPLARKILENNGLIISEYSDKEKIYASNFAARNRIISGLSKGVVIIEADRDSGSLITAKCALDQNRDVFAVPGNIFSQKSTGSNDLIKDGAKLVATAYDIIDEYDKNLQLFPERKNETPTRNSTEKTIVDILSEHGILPIDDIIRKSGLETSEISASLSVLEIRGIVKHTGNGKYRKM